MSKKYSIGHYMDCALQAYGQVPGCDPTSKWHPEDALYEFKPFLEAFLLGWSEGTRDE